MLDGTRSVAVSAAAQEETCVVIGVDADGTVRVTQCRAWGRLSCSYAPRDADWLMKTIGQIVTESISDARAGAAPLAPGAQAA